MDRSALSEKPDNDAAKSALRRAEASWIWESLRAVFRIFCRTWLKVTISGTENLRPDCGALLLINHLSYLDPLVAGVWLNRPVCYLARDNLFRIPLLGSLLKRTFVIPISRESTRTGSIRAAIERLQQGLLVGMFPEGTRSTSGQTERFRPGFLLLARRSTGPIHPVGIAGTEQALGKGKLWIRPARIHVVIGPPISDSEREQLSSGSESELCELLRARVQLCVEEARRLAGN
ncbi:MAG: lysophospholipid acyltransferase family protein [Planctomycetaceae bacterium]|jgi:1-acyl-sn-glycerol-3-phosphate acyltransferase